MYIAKKVKCSAYCFTFTGFGFKQILDRKWCRKYIRHASIEEAKQACDVNEKCFGVYDEDCDGKGDVYICTYGEEIYNSTTDTTDDCIYVQNGKFSMGWIQW